ncbi:fasciculation and elongation protein zeta-2 [Hetaerina americana]|uniref:fasciculation and elongation protein zeta-2 n=1 Tax=Hetaerina americana TaxID=62018 RepID=UPI003A7F3356
MRDISKMAELKFEAPLAQFESEEWGVEFSDFQSTQDARNSNKDANGSLTNGLQQIPSMTAASNALQMDTAACVVNSTAAVVDNAASALRASSPKMGNGELGAENPLAAVASATAEDNFTETFSGSLEDLVNTFDDKITKCFCNYEESVEKLAPVQVRSQEEIMNECQMWWTITGNFGNILPIDWSKSYARKLHMPTLNLNENKGAKGGNGARRRGHHGSRKNGCDEKEEASNDGEEDDDDCDEDDEDDDEDDDEAVACDLDMHSLILSGLRQNGDDEDETPLKTADEVIREIDDMMQETPSTECSVDSERGSLLGSTDALDQKGKEVLQSPLYEDKLKALSVSQLNELYLELEVLIREFSETLIAELALRDELEYEKELKNTFISLLLAVQNRRRQFHVERKRNSRSPKPPATANGLDPKYLTTVIPYHLGSGPPDNQALQVLIKILKAINEDSPTVPTLLTDYILKVLCPT